MENKKLLKVTIASLMLFGTLGSTSNVIKADVIQHESAIIKIKKSFLTAQSNNSKSPNKQLANSVMTPSVKSQIGSDNIKFNNAGAFIIDNNKSNLNVNRNPSPYAVNHQDAQGRAHEGDAWLNKTTRQYKNRAETGNGRTNWKPIGFMQMKLNNGGYSHLYDRGHLLGYALVGNVKRFDASESNPQNIATQTAWANEARSKTSTGQNYYEGIVRKALDQNKTVAYRVTDIYNDNNDKVPMGAHIQAKSTDGTVNINTFIPNVQNGVKINYDNGKASLTH